METPQTTQKQISETVHAILWTEGQGIGRLEIRVASWNGRQAVLEKRQIILDKMTQEEKPGKNKGLRKNEFEWLLKHKDEVLKAFAEAAKK